MLSLRGTSPHPPGPNARFRIRLYLISGRYRIPSGLISTSSGSTSASRISATSLGNGAAESPWKERVQSIFSWGGESGESGASARPVLEMLVVVWWAGVGARMRAVRSSVAGAGAVGEGLDGFAGKVDVDGMGGLGAVRAAWLLLVVTDL
jgi:hypothetical protein